MYTLTFFNNKKKLVHNIILFQSIGFFIHLLTLSKLAIILFKTEDKDGLQ
jgi:hypothetical protein